MSAAMAIVCSGGDILVGGSVVGETGLLTEQLSSYNFCTALAFRQMYHRSYLPLFYKDRPVPYRSRTSLLVFYGKACLIESDSKVYEYEEMGFDLRTRSTLSDE